MIVVADTSPINYLVQLRLEGLLPALYNEVVLPVVVVQELSAAKAPVSVQSWASVLPGWVIVRPDRLSTRAALEGLDDGERAAIEEALCSSADVLLVDERQATQVARSLGLTAVGILGVFLEAEAAGLTDALAVYQRLCGETNFRRNATLHELFVRELMKLR